MCKTKKIAFIEYRIGEAIWFSFSDDIILHALK